MMDEIFQRWVLKSAVLDCLGQLGLEQEPGVDRLVVILLAVQSSSAYTSAFWCSPILPQGEITKPINS
jgi:hypothetical protein